MNTALGKLAGLHQASWNNDPWYRRAWLAGPQALSLVAVILLLTPRIDAPPTNAAWVKPMATQAPPQIADQLLCMNAFAEAKQRGEACDRLIKLGLVTGIELSAAYFGRAWMKQLAQQVDPAIEDYSQALKYNPRNLQAYNGRGRLYSTKNDFERAIQDFDKGLEIDRSSMNAVGFAYRAEARRVLGRLSEAQADINEALRLNDKLEFGQIVRGAIEADIKRRETGSASPVAQTNPPSPPKPPPQSNADAAAIRARGLSKFEQKDYDGAIADFTILIQGASTNFRDYELRGDAYALKRQPDLAIADFTRAIDLPGRTYHPYAKRGELYARRGDYDRAMRDLDTAINDYGAKEAVVFDQRGTLRLRREQYDLALDDFNKVVELAPDAFDGYWGRGLAQTRKLHALIDYCREHRSDQPKRRGGALLADGGGPCSRPIGFQSAVADLKTALAKKPDLADAPYEIGRIYGHLDRFEEAVQAYTDAIRINPNHSYAYNNRGTVYNSLNKRELAFADFNEAIRLDQRRPAPWTNRGDVFMSGGQRQQAISDYRKALDIDANHTPALERLRKLGIKP